MAPRIELVRRLGLATLLLLLLQLASSPAAHAREELAEVALPRDSGPYRAVRALLPERFVEHETRRYLVLSDADPDWSTHQAELLERAYHQFQRFCRRMGLEPRPLRHKLVAVVFSSREEYRRFARRHDGVSDPSLSGYYAPRHDRVVFYDIESSPSVAEARQQLAEMHEQIERLSDRLVDAAAGPQRLRALRRMQGEYLRHWDREQRRVDAYAHQTSIATTVHEAVHQLLFHTEVQSPRVAYPLWISEGLATSFETDEPRSAFGPGHEFAPRRDGVRELVERDGLMPLRELVTIMRFDPSDNERSSVLYHQSYALVNWLSRHRRDELRRYLRDMRQQTGRQRSDQEQLALFEAAFGDADALERAWRRDETTRLATMPASPAGH